MIWRMVLLLIVLAQQPAEQPRALTPAPEPDVQAAVLYFSFIPLLAAGSEVSGAGVDRPLYGYATPHQRSYSVPYYNWGQYPQFCDNPNYWPMARNQMDYDISICDNGDRTLLLYNEPELGSFSATPRQAVDMIERWRADWSGPIACCGNYYGDAGSELTGLQWFLTLVEEYHIKHGIVPPLDAVHLHVYEYRALDVALLKEWRAMADAYGYEVIVSEAGTFPSDDYTAEEIADELPIFLAEVEAILRPDVLMWFSDYLQPWVLGSDVAWHHLNLTEMDGSLTVVGQAWEIYTRQNIAAVRTAQRWLARGGGIKSLAP